MPESRSFRMSAALIGITWTALLVGFPCIGEEHIEPPASPPHTAGMNQSRLLVPGLQAGEITASTTEADLMKLFGRDNVVPGDIDTGEGDMEPGATIFPDEPSNRLSVVWKDPEKRRYPREVTLYGKKSRWHTAEGITLGTTLKELERLNRMPFRLLGFGHDGSGIVTSRGTGTLKALGFMEREASRHTPWKKSLWIALYPEIDEKNKEQWALYRSVLGDSIFSSGHPAMQALNPKVGYISLRFLEAPGG